jgi:outer membrane protein assembly factor BamB
MVNGEDRLKFAATVSIVFLLSIILVPLASADWSMFRGDPSHNGGGTSIPVLSPTQIWNYSTPGEPIRNSPVVANAVVYMSLWDGVYAFNAATGAILWKYKTYNIYSSPAVADGVVYIGIDEGITAFKANDGQKLWSFPTGWRITSSPTVANGIVYEGCMGTGGTPATRFYALNATNGAQMWNLTLGDDLYTSPAVYRGVVYINVGRGIDYLYAVKASTGAELWKYSTASGGSPTVVDDVVYAGSVDYNFYALDWQTGTKIWSFNVTGKEASGASGITSPAVVSGVVYIGSTNGNIYALDAYTGVKLWNSTLNYSTNWGIDSSPAVAGGVLYIGSGDGNLYALNASDGSKLWSFTTPRYSNNGWAISSSPAIDNGVVYIGSFYGCLYAFGNSPNPTPTATPSTMYESADATMYDTRPSCQVAPIQSIRRRSVQGPLSSRCP